MEHSLFLRQYKYEIPGARQAPVLRVFFDFENGGFQLEADCRFISDVNKRFKSVPEPHKYRVYIEADMKPEIPEGAEDNLRNELLLCLKGSIYNGERRNLCSGLLRLNRNVLTGNSTWMIYCNLIDNDLDAFEFRFNLPVFATAIETPHNN